MIAGILVLNLVTSVFVPFAQHALITEPDWNERNAEARCVNDPPTSYCVEPMSKGQVWDHLWQDYWLSLGMTFAGAYLLFPPVWLAASAKLIWFPFQPFVWVLAVSSVPAVWTYSRPMHVAARGAYALVILLLTSSLLWYYWPALPS